MEHERKSHLIEEPLAPGEFLLCADPVRVTADDIRKAQELRDTIGFRSHTVVDRSNPDYLGNYILDSRTGLMYNTNMKTQQQPTVRQINDHLSSMSSYCMVYATGFQMRISRARTNKGTKEGRVINYSYSGREASNVGPVKDWEPIPADAVVELT